MKPLLASIAVLMLRIRQRFCNHKWRPVGLQGCYGSWCPICDKSEKLNTPDFYARFGIMPHRWY